MSAGGSILKPTPSVGDHLGSTRSLRLRSTSSSVVLLNLFPQQQVYDLYYQSFRDLRLAEPFADGSLDRFTEVVVLHPW